MNVNGLELAVKSYTILGTEVDIDQMEDKGWVKWAVRSPDGCLSHLGRWDWEPLPSHRTPSFLDRHRFLTLEEAVAAYQRSLQQQGAQQ